MSENELLGHMTECTETASSSGCFIPHHGVLRESSTTIQDASQIHARCPLFFWRLF